MNSQIITSLLVITLRSATALLIAALGEIFVEKSGELNLGIEGMMVTSAVTGFAAAYYSQSALIGILVAMMVGGLLATLHAFLTISLKANTTFSGVTMTFFGGGLASFLGQRLGPGGKSLVGLIGPSLNRIPLPVLAKIPILGSVLFNQDALTYLAFLMVPASWVLLYYTVPGLRLRAVGAYPQAAQAQGINVERTKYVWVIVGGILAGLGGAYLSLVATPGWSENLTGGRGVIVIAMVAFARQNPFGVVMAALIFGGMNAVQFRLQAVGVSLPVYFLLALPYLSTIAVLVISALVKKRR